MAELTREIDDHTPAGLVVWLRNQYARHHEIEDKLAADLIENLSVAAALKQPSERETIEREVREQCYKALCEFCAAGDPLYCYPQPDGKLLHNYNGRPFPCKAAAIRALSQTTPAAQQREGDLASASTAGLSLTEAMAQALRHAEEWIAATQHGDNCYVSNHYAGDPGNQCNCGKESVMTHLDEAIVALASVVGTPPDVSPPDEQSPPAANETAGEWVRVPREPTDAMTTDGFTTYCEGEQLTLTGEQIVTRIYKAMLSAAPNSPAA